MKMEFSGLMTQSSPDARSRTYILRGATARSVHADGKFEGLFGRSLASQLQNDVRILQVMFEEFS